MKTAIGCPDDEPNEQPIIIGSGGWNGPISGWAVGFSANTTASSGIAIGSGAVIAQRCRWCGHDNP